MTLLLWQRREGGRQAADRITAFDEMWNCVGGRHGEKWREVWLWTAVSLGSDGRRQVDFELGGRGEATLLRLYERLPEAETYCSDAYVVYQS